MILGTGLLHGSFTLKIIAPRDNAPYNTKKIFFAGYSIDTGYVTKKIKPEKRPICHNVIASTKARMSPRSPTGK